MCGERFLLFLSLNCGTWEGEGGGRRGRGGEGLQDTTRMSMTVAVREALCVHAVGAWALQGRSLHKGAELLKKRRYQ